MALRSRVFCRGAAALRFRAGRIATAHLGKLGGQCLIGRARRGRGGNLRLRHGCPQAARRRDSRAGALARRRDARHLLLPQGAGAGGAGTLVAAALGKADAAHGAVAACPPLRIGGSQPVESGHAALGSAGLPPRYRLNKASGGDGFAGFPLDARDHGSQAVGTLRRDVLGKPQLVENAALVGARDFRGALAGKDRQNDCDETAHNMRVEVAPELQHRVGPVFVFRDNPDLAGAALHLVLRRVLGFGQRLKTAAKLDQIAVAVVPVVEKLEILDNGVDIRIGHARSLVALPNIGRCGRSGNAALKDPS